MNHEFSQMQSSTHIWSIFYLLHLIQPANIVPRCFLPSAILAIHSTGGVFYIPLVGESIYPLHAAFILVEYFCTTVGKRHQTILNPAQVYVHGGLESNKNSWTHRLSRKQIALLQSAPWLNFCPYPGLGKWAVSKILQCVLVPYYSF